MKLSKYFTFEELTVSSYAKRNKIPNTPNTLQLETLKQTAKQMDKVRELLNVPIIVNSGFRSVAVNRGIGSSDNSQHCKGEAVDFVTHQYTPRQIVEMIRKSDIPYDQLILEYESWVHLSFSSDNRKQFFVIS